MTTFTFMDLFAGIGGFHAALAEMGGECVLAVEKDEEAALVYQENWGIDPRGDVTLVDWAAERLKLEEDGKTLDVLTAGFPCQPFSKGGAQRGVEEARGTLFFNVLEALAEMRPGVVLLENVRNLTGPKHTHTWEVIITSLRELGYEVSSTPLVVSPSWLEADEGGAPQNRERVFILGTLRPGAADEAADLAWPGKTELTVELNRRLETWDLELELPLEEELIEVIGAPAPPTWGPNVELSTQELTWVAAWEEFVELAREQGAELPGHPLWVDAWAWEPGGTAELELDPGMPAWKRVFIIKNVTWWKLNSSWAGSWARRWKVNTFPGSRRKLEWQAGDAADMSSCLVQMRPSGLRVKKATHTGALVAIDQRPIVMSRGRRLTVRECARLQGMPETFTFGSVSEKAAFKQLGNGVNAGVVKAVFGGHLRHLQAEGHPLAVRVLDVR